jgi:hypothetical protein
VELSYHSLVRRGPDGGIVVQLDTVAAGTMWEAVEQTRDLLLDREPGESAASGPGSAAGPDTFEAIVADLEGAGSRPAPRDPVLRRLLPDGVDADSEAAAEFRAATERGLLRRKVSALDVVLGDLERLRAGEGSVRIPPEGVRAWLSGVNDARLALGTLLDIRQDEDLMAELDEYLDEVDVTASGEDARTLRAYRILVYDLLTELQARILAAVD